ncbi:MAG TPA: nucleotidyltransferase family protein [Gemmatimonadaceae bacterium]|nr:nucleotidyltransferase family protein [Gemmatimonadaceae bacterium]
MISAIVLAAGLAKRFGSPKVLATYQRKPLVRHVVEALSTPDVADIVVVVRRPKTPYIKALASTRARVVVNEDPATGMSTSLHTALQALNPATEAVLIALGDQPLIEPSVVESLIHEWQRSRSCIVAPLYREERGHPVLFDASVFPELLRVRGDQGARAVVDRDPERVCLLALDRDAPRDVDTQADLLALRRTQVH